jgi:hypothetical protein
MEGADLPEFSRVFGGGVWTPADVGNIPCPVGRGRRGLGSTFAWQQQSTTESHVYLS